MSSYRESVTPIFDEVDRRWRMTEDAGDDTGGDGGEETPPSMLSFPGTASPARPVPARSAAPRREPGPRHALRR